MLFVTEYSLSVVFPVFNEEENIRKLLHQTTQCLSNITEEWEIICVDDGSSDRSGELIADVARDDDRVKLVSHSSNQGYGSALKSGFQVACNDLVFFCDSDLQFHLTEILLMMVWIEQFDIVIGYRSPRKDPPIRLLNAQAWNVLVRLVLGLKVRDIDCAFKLFRRDVFSAVKIESVGAMVNTEILTQAFKMNFKIKEVPVTHFPRRYGEQSGANIKVIIKAFKELYALRGKLRNVPQVVFDDDRRSRELRLAGIEKRSKERRKELLPICFRDRRKRRVRLSDNKSCFYTGEGEIESSLPE